MAQHKEEKKRGRGELFTRYTRLKERKHLSLLLENGANTYTRKQAKALRSSTGEYTLAVQCLRGHINA